MRVSLMESESVQRTLTAILSAHAKASSLPVGDDEAETTRTLTSYHEVMANLIQKYRGRVVYCPGNNLLGEFSNVASAVQCAVEIRQEVHSINAELPRNRTMEFGIGINLGEAVEEGGRISGDGVDIATCVAKLADAAGICISGVVYARIGNELLLRYEYLGEFAFKNVTEPIRVYRIHMRPRAAIGRIRIETRAAVRRRRMVALALAILALAGLAWLVVQAWRVG